MADLLQPGSIAGILNVCVRSLTGANAVVTRSSEEEVSPPRAGALGDRNVVALWVGSRGGQGRVGPGIRQREVANVARVGGLTIATFTTLLLVPVLYSIFVLDLKIIRWEGPKGD